MSVNVASVHLPLHLVVVVESVNVACFHLPLHIVVVVVSAIVACVHLPLRLVVVVVSVNNHLMSPVFTFLYIFFRNLAAILQPLVRLGLERV